MVNQATHTLPVPVSMSTPSPTCHPRPPAEISEIIQMALSDHVSFEQLRLLHGLTPDQVKALMRQQLKPGSYVAWRKRVRQFSDRRAFYK